MSRHRRRRTQSFAAQIAGNILQGLVLGAIYGVATMGLSLIFGVLRVVNVGHGALRDARRFTAWWTVSVLQRAAARGAAAGDRARALIGFFFYYTALKRLLKRRSSRRCSATFALGVVLEEVVKHTFTSESRGYTWDIGSLDLGVTTLPVRSLTRRAGKRRHRRGHLFVVHALARRHRDARRRAR